MSDSVTGSMRLYTSSGIAVTLPVPVDGENYDYVHALASVESALAAGWLAEPPEGGKAGEGETREEIGWVARRSKKNQDGSKTSVVDLYSTHPALKKPVLSVYLDRAEDIAAFETASGLKVNALQVYPGKDKIERGADSDLDAMVKQAPKPFGVVFGPNPRYSAEEAAAVLARGKNEVYGVPKKKFLRWDSGSAGAPAAGAKPVGAHAGGAPAADARTSGRDDGGARDDSEFNYLLSGVQHASSEPALVEAWTEVNDAIKGNRLTSAQQTTLMNAKEKRKGELASRRRQAVNAPPDDEAPIPF